MGDTLVDHYLRAWVSFLNWINVVLWTISCVVHIFLTSIWTSENSRCPFMGTAIDIWEPLISGLQLPLKEFDMQQQKELSILAVSSPSPSIHPSRLGSSASRHFTKNGVDMTTSVSLLTPSNRHFSDISLHLTGTSTRWSLSPFFSLFLRYYVDFTPEN